MGRHNNWISAVESITKTTRLAVSLLAMSPHLKYWEGSWPTIEGFPGPNTHLHCLHSDVVIISGMW